MARTTVPQFKENEKKVSVEEQLKNEVVKMPDDAKVESFIDGAESSNEPKAKHPGGRPPLSEEEKKVGITLYLPKTLLADITAAAKKRMLPRNSYIISCLVNSLEQQD
ncbi:MAG: hypothetical protein K6G11_08270 [Lachnospiraceae bacterium]|nr:hypothetical protein [Lachnospiraceae bacterium]